MAENFLTAKNILIGLNATSKKDAINKMSQKLEENGIVTDSKKFSADVMERESLTTTGIGNNIAIPHGKSSSVKEASFIFAKNQTPLEWNSLDGSPVDIIFLMAVRSDDVGKDHLKMLAKLSGKLMDDDFVATIKKENDPQKLVEIFSKD
ncbi:PTS mannose transporter subunit IIAB [Xylocopilactobacillus apicola]|uniref:PTS mannose transporter subunit IIAB n=1 Tax=Xylocopilactobacillus apicola TaxID=2932184 RepID=A0AAU9D2U9_9LACO|nr:fructose PTS transporter subunit IIA [Xylocopilactobacillus apicola]BDR58074.1 PTS mannose transporter subunit IIAB [Xylocopilactobacillus apicola]